MTLAAGKQEEFKQVMSLDRLRRTRRFAHLVLGLCAVASVLQAAVSQLSQPSWPDAEAHELYLKGRSHWDKRTLADLETAVSYFERAIAKDPGYALAYTGLADAYAVMPDYGGSASEVVPKAIAAARKALELDPTLARPHADLAYIKMWHEWDFAGGEAEFKKALALDPNDATAHQWYGDIVGTIGGREQEALAEITRAHDLDLSSRIITYDLGHNHILARRYDEAIAVCRKLADEDPKFAMAHIGLSSAYWRKGMYSASIDEYKTYSRIAGDRNASEVASAMERGLRSGGRRGALEKGIEASLAQRQTGDASAYEIASLYADLGEKDRAFEWLNTAVQERDANLIGLCTDASFDSIRTSPRFAALMEKVGLPESARNPEAYELYRKGRSAMQERTLANSKTAVSYFNQAIARDPGYAQAYSGLARVYSLLTDYGQSPVEDHPKAMAFARKALELDPTLAEPHLVLGGQMMFQDWDVAGGVAEFKRAVELAPDDAEVHHRYALNICLVGGMEQEALAQILRARELDSRSQRIRYDLGAVHVNARRFDDAVAVCKALANDSPAFADAHECLATAYWGKRMYSQAIVEYETYARLSHDEFASALVEGFASGGWKGALNEGIGSLQTQRKTQPSSSYGTAFLIAALYAQLGDKDRALHWLDIAFQEHDEGLMALKTDFTLDPIRSDPRFAELVRKVGLPQ